MKRLCFDTESTYYKSPYSPIGDPAWHREYFRKMGKKFEFHCGVIYNAKARKYREFSRGKARAFVDLLSTADELISHSGRRVDLIVLEHSCGEEAVAPLWEIPHWDLFYIHNWESLTDLARRLIPRLNKRCDRRLKEANVRAAARWPVVNNWVSESLFIAEKLAKARRDVELTYRVFKMKDDGRSRDGSNPHSKHSGPERS